METKVSTMFEHTPICQRCNELMGPNIDGSYEGATLCRKCSRVIVGAIAKPVLFGKCPNCKERDISYPAPYCQYCLAEISDREGYLPW